MSSLRAPVLGPIVGHTTSNSCRLWIRAGDPADEDGKLDENRRSIGVITVLDRKGNPDPNEPDRTQYFRLHREYDRTGTFNLGVDSGLNGDTGPLVLTPETHYRVRMGTLALDDAFSNDESLGDKEIGSRLPNPSVWAKDLAALPAEKSEARFRTFPKRIANTLSFLIGSCRYPGLFWKKKHSDRIFGPMFDHIEDNPYKKTPGFVLMVGDQIYADMFNRWVPIGLADTYREFQDRYHDAYGSLNMRRLLRSVPNYMILDDHEIEDNWTQDRIHDRRKRVIFHLAIGAYMSYQWSHGPRNYAGRLFYSFECGGFPFFVLDGRTARFKDDEPGMDDNHLLGRPSFDPKKEPNQLDHLCDWLTTQQKMQGDRPKFIVSATVFVPNEVVTTRSDRHKEKSDSWAAFPETRRELLGHIVKNNVQNVVFLSGDIHCANVAKMTLSGSKQTKALRAFSITSSAFYWPFPFADGEPSDYVHNSLKQNDSFVVDPTPLTGQITMDYKAENFVQDDNFCQVDVEWKKKMIEVRTIGQEGNLIVRSVLHLA